MSLFEIIQLGRKYLKLWPKRPELLHYFAEYRQVSVARFVCQYAWHFAVLTLILPVVANAMTYFSQSVASALFIASLPMQAHIMLGLQADKFLPPSLAAWYREGVARLNEQGGNSHIELSIHKPKYIDLVNLLSISYK